MTVGSNDWMPLSVREGRARPIPFFDEIPPEAIGPLHNWLEGQFGFRTPGGLNTTTMLNVGLASRVPVDRSGDNTRMMRSILAACSADSSTFLDVLDATLNLRGGSGAGELDQTLRLAKLAYTVGDDRRSLVRRVDPAITRLAGQTMAPEGNASSELQEAWSSAFELHPNPSDAWDHSIKAVEAVMIPIVCPLQDKPTLGHVLGTLRADISHWQLLISNGDPEHALQTLVAMLDLLWPNPDRHGNPSGRRTPTEVEGRSVTFLATTIVGWMQEGILRKR